MYKKFNQLSFVIGLFFFLVSLILFVHILLSDSTGKLNFYTAIAFLIFGVAMMMAKDPAPDQPESKN
ncbi:MAG TPA: hypothetical protein VKA49_19720 [Flavitalea sp.]|nr:hypothetical protein [Flavitalea sp.]